MYGLQNFIYLVVCKTNERFDKGKQVTLLAAKKALTNVMKSRT
jgi:hypothetical protein